MARDRIQPSAQQRVRRARELLARALRGPRRVGFVDRWLHATVDYVLDCPTVRRELSNAYDDDLPRWKAALVRAHVSTCAVCGPIDAALRDTVATLNALRDEPASSE